MSALKALLPLLAAALALAAALIILAPVRAAAPHAVDRAAVFWGPPSDRRLPRRAAEGEVWRTLVRPQSQTGGGPRQYSWRFEADELPEAAAALAPDSGPTPKLYFNNVRVLLVEGPVRLRAGRRAALALLPPDYAHPGPDDFAMVVEAPPPHGWPRGFYIGPRPVLEAAGRRLELIEVWGPRLAGMLGGAAALLGALAALSTSRRHYAVPAAAMLLFAALAAFPALDGGATGGVAAETLTLFFALFLLTLIVGELGRESRLFRYAFRFSLGVAGVYAAAAAFSLSPSIAAERAMNAIAATAALVSGAGVLAILTTQPRIRSAWTPLQLAAGGFAAAAVIAAGVSRLDVIPPLAVYLAEAAFLCAAAGCFAVWSLHAGGRLALDSEAFLQRRLGLARIIREQERRIEDQQAALRVEAQRRAVLEERERFSRDMHDGVGGGLLALLLQVRAGKIAGDRLATELERNLDELRLMIDALDHSETSLAAALSAFHTRVVPEFEAAGVALDWRVSDLDGFPPSDPARLMHLYRILQEACVNVLKHARAGRAAIAIDWERSAGALKVSIENDGAGAPRAGPGGKGLKNMARRAEALRGVFAAGPLDEGGWRVSLSIPA